MLAEDPCHPSKGQHYGLPCTCLPNSGFRKIPLSLLPTQTPTSGHEKITYLGLLLASALPGLLLRQGWRFQPGTSRDGPVLRMKQHPQPGPDRSSLYTRAQTDDRSLEILNRQNVSAGNGPTSAPTLEAPPR